jgi:hypothetical protein
MRVLSSPEVDYEYVDARPSLSIVDACEGAGRKSEFEDLLAGMEPAFVDVVRVLFGEIDETEADADTLEIVRYFQNWARSLPQRQCA